MTGEFDDLEQIADQNRISANTPMRPQTKSSWARPPNLLHTHVEREKKAAKPEKQPAVAPRPTIAEPPPSIGTPVTSYTELIGAIEAGRVEMGIRQLDFDDLAGFAPGLWGKVSGLLQVKQVRVEKLFDALRAAGFQIELKIDPEQRAKMVERCSNNYNPRVGFQARNGHAASLPSTPVLNRVMQPWRKIGGKKRWQRKSKEDRSAHGSMMANERWKKVRKRRRVANKRREREREKAKALEAA